MHMFGSTQNSIYRAGLNAQCAAYAGVFVDKGYRFWFWGAMFGVERLVFDAHQLGQGARAGITARRALVNVCLAIGDCGGIGFADPRL